jgi:sulfite reductase (NADPH) hemoprotein beta-component
MTEPNPSQPPPQQLSEAEQIKAGSRYLRGTIEQSLADPLTGAVAPVDAQLLKFHGTYQQDDRDLRNERERQKLEPAYEFMIRVRAPGGIVTPAQWLVLDRLAQQHANGTLRLTTRQAFQFHGVLKWRLKETIAEVNRTLLDTLAACGDVNRNVMCNPNPCQSEVHGEVYEWSKRLSEHLSPKTTAYHEIWLDKKKLVDTQEDHEPLYGATYLPRKFKIAVAVPPSNDVDVLANDLGLIAIIEDGRLQGFNVGVGGGMGMTHGEPDTYPNLAWVIGICRPEQVIAVAEKVILVQRDFGDRTSRKHARLKYTIDDRGVGWFKAELDRRLGWDLEPSRPYHFEHHGDRYGWTQGANGHWHLTLFIENGRIRDRDDHPLMTGLRTIAQEHQGDFRLTPNENLIIANIAPERKARIEQLVEQFKLTGGRPVSALRRNSMSCVALPTCGQAMAEAERYLPELIGKLDEIMEEAGLGEDEIVVRMTGCPNGCARPYLGEIGLVGKAPGRYNLYLGADFAGQRLNKLYRENIDEAEILETLKPIIHRYAKERGPGERFGDFVIRSGYVEAVKVGREFHRRPETKFAP